MFFSESVGLTFGFKVNDIDVFMKGSNWIPANILPEWGANYSTGNNIVIYSIIIQKHINKYIISPMASAIC